MHAYYFSRFSLFSNHVYNEYTNGNISSRIQKQKSPESASGL